MRELKKETGVSGPRHSFDIKSGSVTQEVGVDIWFVNLHLH
jgi:hypothetical protein